MRHDRKRFEIDYQIDLLGLLDLLWRRRLFILMISLFTLFLSVLYVCVRTPVYQATAIVELPTQNDISHLNYGRGGDTGLEIFSPAEVYELYVRNLLSESMRRQFFQAVYLPSLDGEQRQGSREALYADFLQVLQIVPLGKEPPFRYAITVKLPDASQSAQWAVRYAELAGVNAKAEILKNIESDANVRAESLRQQIAAEREKARRQREDREARLSEALTVAKSIGLERPPVISGQLGGELSSGIVGELSYMRGSDALEAEIEGLRARPSDDPFIPGLREKQAELDFYDGLKVLPASIGVYRQDGAVELPDQSILPRWTMIVVMGLVFGVVMSVVIVLAHHVISAVFLSIGAGPSVNGKDAGG